MSLIKRGIKKISRIWKKFWRLKELKRLGLRNVDPNFIYNPKFDQSSEIIDVGCSYEADFSRYMIDNYGVMAFAVDPTRKHRGALELLQQKYNGQLKHVPLAVSSEDSSLTFHESRVNESGSILNDHVNILRDDTISYEVRSVSLLGLLDELGLKKAEIIKLDLEGAEYPLLLDIEQDQIEPFNQLFIEFHHHAIAQFDESHTRKVVSRIKSFGFKAFSLDDHNYLFYK